MPVRLVVLALGALPPWSNLQIFAPLCGLLQLLGGHWELLQPPGHGLCCSAPLRSTWNTSRHLACVAHSVGEGRGWVGLMLESRAGTCWMLSREVWGTSASPGCVGPSRRQDHDGKPGLELGLLSRTSPCPPVLGGCLCQKGSSKRPGPPRGTCPPPSCCSLCPTMCSLACELPCHQILGLKYRILCRRWVMLSDGLRRGGWPWRRGVLLARMGGQNLRAILSHPSALNFPALPTVRHRLPISHKCSMLQIRRA